jgi:hypothetical protein
LSGAVAEGAALICFDPTIGGFLEWNVMEATRSDNSGGFFRRSVLFPDSYVWLIFVSALDLMFTCLIIQLGGYEANVLADHVMDKFGLPGIAVFKFGLVTVVILIAEYVGRQKHNLGRQLASYSVAFPLTGVVVGAILLMRLSQEV